MYGCECWTIKSWLLKNWYVQIVVLEKTLEKSLGKQGDQISQSQKEINPEYSLEGLILKLKLQYFGHLAHWKRLMLGKIEGRRRRVEQRMRGLDSTTNSMDVNLSKLRETVKDRAAWNAAAHGVTQSQRWLLHWILTTRIIELTFTDGWPDIQILFINYNFAVWAGLTLKYPS